MNIETFNPKKSKLNRKESLFALLFVLLPIIGFLLFTVASMGFSIFYSFFNINAIKNTQTFVGFKNYTDLFNGSYSKVFIRSVGNTLILALSVPFGMILGLLLAAFMNNKKIHGSKLFRILFYLPAVSSAVALNIIWRYMFRHEIGVGVINTIFKKKIEWLYDGRLIKVAIIVKNVWAGLGSSLILYLAGMMNISRSYYEAAEIDGANRITQFFKITVPMLTPITFYMLIMGFIGALQSYADAQVFAQGNEGAQTIVYFIWFYALSSDGGAKYGFACAASVFLAACIMVITVIQFKLSKRWVYDE